MKTKVLVIFGGKSTEHEVSCRSALSILKNLDPAKFELGALAIDKKGRWLPQDVQVLRKLDSPADLIQSKRVLKECYQEGLQLSRSFAERLLDKNGSADPQLSNLVIFPIIHGTFGEDGTLQGLIEQAELAFVGPDTTGSALAMDKA